MRIFKVFVSFVFVLVISFAQTTTPTTPATPAPAGPTYFTNTGIRYSYYDSTLTETTNIGVKMSSSTTPTSVPTVPQGAWAVLSIDATPRSQATSAAARIGVRYFLKSAASGNLIFHTEAGVGAATVSASGAAATALLNVQPGVGVTWRICHTFNPKLTVNCVADFDYDINYVSTQAVKPLVGVFLGVAF